MALCFSNISSYKQLLKVGEYQHLKSFVDGHLNFSFYQSYCGNDDYRSDNMEGLYNVEWSKGFELAGLVGGVDIPMPDSVKSGYDVHDIFILSFANLTQVTSEFLDDTLMSENSNFLKHMRQFGSTALIITIDELLSHLYQACEECCNEFDFIAKPVYYVDKNADYEKIGQLLRENVYNLYFMKDLKYRLQCEYRVLLRYPRYRDKSRFLLDVKPFQTYILGPFDVLFNKQNIKVD